MLLIADVALTPPSARDMSTGRTDAEGRSFSERDEEREATTSGQMGRESITND